MANENSRLHQQVGIFLCFFVAKRGILLYNRCVCAYVKCVPLEKEEFDYVCG